ncbi:MAG: hypothetical protein J7574_15750 [Flavobacterium sp.]|uniref:hypothetical protein n=1 Tax=Flavobacterium sp. TaxID=239 RepID=UPI001B092A01|nr:hypothetical protein [Flavobacterium sp.]MBO9585620.1 hypothetical protein [Flavobacterium sp.]
MKKICFYLLAPFIITGCDSKEELSSKSQSTKNPTQTYIINGDIVYEAEITDGSKPKKPIFIYDIPKSTDNGTIKKQTLKASNETTVLNFNYGIGESTQSGCQVKRYKYGTTEAYYTDQGVYGFNPYPHPTSDGNSCLVRGFGLPHQNLYYGSLVLIASNRGGQIEDNRKQIINCNISRGSNISIEFPFKENKTYEVSITTYFNDNIPITESKHSNGFPTLYAQLRDSGIIVDNAESCETDKILQSREPNSNYIKSYTLDNNIKENKNLKFNFLTTEAKKALLISLIPSMGINGINAKIPKNSYTMLLKNITITEKPFDNSLVTSPPPGRR